VFADAEAIAVAHDDQCRRFGCTPYAELDGSARCDQCGRAFAAADSIAHGRMPVPEEA
jgi:hypothetical protein